MNSLLYNFSVNMSKLLTYALPGATKLLLITSKFNLTMTLLCLINVFWAKSTNEYCLIRVLVICMLILLICFIISPWLVPYLVSFISLHKPFTLSGAIILIIGAERGLGKHTDIAQTKLLLVGINFSELTAPSVHNVLRQPKLPSTRASAI